MTGARWVAGGVVVAASVGWLAFEVAGAAGVSWCAAGLVALLVLAVRMRWAVEHVRAGAGPGEASATHGRYPGFAVLYSKLAWAQMERRHFDRILRPLLWRLLLVAVTERHGAVVAADTAWIRAQLGEDAWRLLDPDRPEWTDTVGQRAPGPDMQTLRRLVDRIEQL